LSEKAVIRRRIWRKMEESGVARFPKPIEGRIPNFEGSEKAAQKLVGLEEFQRARVVKVNPDSPQTHVRRGVLLNGKLLIIPTPRLRRGFILLDPKMIPRKFLIGSSTIRGAFRYGKSCPLEELPEVDLIAAGSVAVSQDGVRIGKGGGYSEIEYGILREFGLVGEETPIFTTVHDLQIVSSAPKEEHDFVVDAIITPSKIVRLERKYPQPRGIIWERLSKDDLTAMPILNELRDIIHK